jgi:hypothetical protein
MSPGVFAGGGERREFISQWYVGNVRHAVHPSSDYANAAFAQK